jgi:molybdopterin converting factor subunit 1
MIRLFGIAKDIVGARELSWPSNHIEHVGALKEWLLEQYPQFSDLKSLRFAVNEEYAEDDRLIGPDDEIVLIPPVAGG